MKNIKEAIIEANNQFYYGLNEMFVGNLETLTNLWAHSDSITYMGCLIRLRTNDFKWPYGRNTKCPIFA